MQRRNTKKITLGKAKEIALKQAGVKDSQAVYTKAGQDWDDGRLVYKVEFVSGGLEYECKIDAGQGRLWTGTWSMINRPVRRWKKMGKSGVDQVLVGGVVFCSCCR